MARPVKFVSAREVISSVSSGDLTVVVDSHRMVVGLGRQVLLRVGANAGCKRRLGDADLVD